MSLLARSTIHGWNWIRAARAQLEHVLLLCADDDGGCDAACQQRSNAKQMEQRLEDKHSVDGTNSTIEIVGGFVGAAVLGFVYDKWCKKHCCCNDDETTTSRQRWKWSRPRQLRWTIQ